MSTMMQNEVPPPPYSFSEGNEPSSSSQTNPATMRPDFGNRPTNLWKISVCSQFDIYPFASIKFLRWCLKEELAIDYEISFESISDGIGRLVKKFGCYRGKAGESSPAFTYTPLTGHLNSTETDLTIKCNYDVNKASKNQSLSFKFQGETYKWISNSIMCTIRGHSIDMTKSFLVNSQGMQLASFSWLLPDGNFDACIRPSSDLIQSIPNEILIMTFTCFYYHQEDTMNQEIRELSRDVRIATLQMIRDNLTPGRMIIYGVGSLEELDHRINESKERYKGEYAAKVARDRRTGRSDASNFVVYSS